jgi:hypothetical protein
MNEKDTSIFRKDFQMRLSAQQVRHVTNKFQVPFRGGLRGQKMKQNVSNNLMYTLPNTG